MLLTFVYYIMGGIVGAIAGVSNGFAFVLPSYFLTGIRDALAGANNLNAFLPMYPHPNMVGIASQTGIMPLFGWLLIMLFVMAVVKIVQLCIRLVLRILPWNTAGETSNENLDRYIDRQ